MVNNKKFFIFPTKWRVYVKKIINKNIKKEYKYSNVRLNVGQIWFIVTDDISFEYNRTMVIIKETTLDVWLNFMDINQTKQL